MECNICIVTRAAVSHNDTMSHTTHVDNASTLTSLFQQRIGYVENVAQFGQSHITFSAKNRIKEEI